MNRLPHYHDLLKKAHAPRLAALSAPYAHRALKIVLLAVIYFMTARLGFFFAPGQQVTAIWPAAGIGLASILMFGYEVWPGILLGSFFSKLSVGDPAWLAFAVGTANTVEPLLGAALQRFYLGPNHYLNRIPGIMGLWFFASFVSTLVGAVVGVTAIWMSGLTDGAPYYDMLLTWWLADAAGSLVVTPFLLAWGSGRYTLPKLNAFVEAVALLAVTVAAFLIIFIRPLGNAAFYPYMMFPFVIWAALRFGARGATLMAVAICTVALSATLSGVGPFAGVPEDQSLVETQIFVMILTIVGLTVSAAIAERETAERRMLEGKDYLQSIIDNIPDPVFMKDRQHRLIGGNKAMWALLRAPAEKIIGSRCEALFRDKAEVDAFNERYEEVFHTGKTDISELPFTDTGGKHHVLALKAALIRPAGQPPFIVAVARDITSLKETEELLLKYTQDLELRNRDLDDFAHIASHDLKEPLRGMGIAAALLLEDHRATMGKEIECGLERIISLSRRMISRVDALLRFARLGRRAPAPTSIDPNAIVNNVREMLGPLLKEQNATIIVPRPMPTAVCDGQGLEEILSNLVVNAVKYNDKPVKTVEIGMRDAAMSPQGPVHDVFYVRDNGIGIRPEFHEVIFRLYKRLPDSEKYNETGTGIGLTFVKRIVEANDGTIWVESEPGKGAIFYFTLCKQAAP